MVIKPTASSNPTPSNKPPASEVAPAAVGNNYQVWTLDDLRQPPPPHNWLVEGLIEGGKVTDVFGMPGEGKSTILNNLAAAIAAGMSSWCGLKIASGKVAMVGGEISNLASMQRLTQRLVSSYPDLACAEQDQLKVFPDSSPIWHYDSKGDGWILTKYGNWLTGMLIQSRPVLCIVDTITGAADFGTGGGDPVNVQYQLGKAIMRWCNDVESAVITVSHTNQSSVSGNTAERLSYLSRTGTNGYPGALRSLIGVTRLRDEETEALGYGGRSIVAMGVSKFNEHPTPPIWTNKYPALFDYTKSGLLLVKDGRELQREKGLEAVLSNKKAAEAKGTGYKNHRQQRTDSSSIFDAVRRTAKDGDNVPF